jgi:hypothetical protein
MTSYRKENEMTKLTWLAVAFMMASGCGDGAMTAPSGTGGSGGGGSTGSAGSTGGGGSSGLCNTLANVGTDVPVTTNAGAVPTMTGGQIADGTYVLTSQVVYAGGSTAGLGPLKQTFVIAGNTVQVVQKGQDNVDEHQTIQLDPSGTQLNFAYSCPTPGAKIDGPYTATATTFSVVLSGNWVLTSTKL